jgi:hypothetical protein
MFALVETYNFEYDSKTNPLQFTSEASVLGMPNYYSSNNTSKINHVAASPANNFVSNITFTYNNSNRPLTSNSVTGTTTTTTTYTYQ